MVQDDIDFANHMEEIRKMEAMGEKDEIMFHSHEVWRKSTVSGWLVTQLIAVGNHFRPFFQEVSSALSNDQSIGRRLISLFLRLLVIAVFFVVITACGRILQMIVGEEIQATDEIVIVEEVPRSIAEKEGIVEGERVLNASEAKERLARLQREQQEVAAEEEVSKNRPRRAARDKKNQ
mmetsp:Transcript_2855/g.4251  ORF Transcript_2855/g.4251 Transcript_2855/m.4251 type:complete len:178 (+) Transcript_2855:238-771(+)